MGTGMVVGLVLSFEVVLCFVWGKVELCGVVYRRFVVGCVVTHEVVLGWVLGKDELCGVVAGSALGSTVSSKLGKALACSSLAAIYLPL